MSEIRIGTRVIPKTGSVDMGGKITKGRIVDMVVTDNGRRDRELVRVIVELDNGKTMSCLSHNFIVEDDTDTLTTPPRS